MAASGDGRWSNVASCGRAVSVCRYYVWVNVWLRSMSNAVVMQMEMFDFWKWVCWERARERENPIESNKIECLQSSHGIRMWIALTEAWWVMKQTRRHTKPLYLLSPIDLCHCQSTPLHSTPVHFQLSNDAIKPMTQQTILNQFQFESNRWKSISSILTSKHRMVGTYIGMGNEFLLAKTLIVPPDQRNP